MLSSRIRREWRRAGRLIGGVSRETDCRASGPRPRAAPPLPGRWIHSHTTRFRVLLRSAIRPGGRGLIRRSTALRPRCATKKPRHRGSPLDPARIGGIQPGFPAWTGATRRPGAVRLRGVDHPRSAPKPGQISTGFNRRQQDGPGESSSTAGTRRAGVAPVLESKQHGLRSCGGRTLRRSYPAGPSTGLRGAAHVAAGLRIAPDDHGAP